MNWGQARNLWEKWDRAVEGGKTPADFLPEISDESLIQLLMTAEGDRNHDRDVIATEAFNRILRTRRRLEEVTTATAMAVDHMDETLKRAAPAIHTNENLAERAARGEELETADQLDAAHAASVLIEVVKDAMTQVERARERLAHFRDYRMSTAREKPEDFTATD